MGNISEYFLNGLILIDWVFLVIVGENGCWLAGFGVIYSANELPLVVVKLSFMCYWNTYFSMGFS